MSGTLDFPGAPALGATYTLGGRTFVYDGAKWASGGIELRPTIAAAAPSNPRHGDLWWDSRIGNLFVFYNDGATPNWVNAASASGAFLPIWGGTLTGTMVVNADATATSLNSGPIAGYRNQVMNGDFRINQRNTASTTTHNSYVVDRWNLFIINGSRTVQRVALADSDRAVIGRGEALWCIQYAATGGSAAGDRECLQQRIEDVRTFAGRTITVSWWARRTAGSGNMSMDLVQSTGTGGSPSASVQGIGAEQFTLTTSWQRFTRTVAMPTMTSLTLGTNDNDHVALTFWFSAGTNFAARTGNLGVQTGTFQIADVQMEAGPVATPFEQRMLSAELALCQRHFATSFPAGVVPAQNAGLTGAVRCGQLGGAGVNSLYGPFSLPVPMKRAPTVVIFNPAAANAQMRNIGFGVDFSSTTVATLATSFVATATSGAGTGAGSGVVFHYTAEAELA